MSVIPIAKVIACCGLIAFARPVTSVSAPTNGVSAAACKGVSNIDFQNNIVDWGGGRLKFKDGRACTTEGLLPGQNPDCDCDSGKCDWQMKVSEDRLLSPEPGWQLRLLIVEEDHLTGSGAWGRVLLYECQNHQLKTVMDQRYLYGVQFCATKDGFKLEYGDWFPGDPRCCPSGRREDFFRWERAEHKYLRTQSVVLKSDA